MARSDDGAALDRARREISSIAAEFREVAAPAVGEMLRRRLEALLEARKSWWGGLADDVQDAFRSAASGAIAAGEAETRRRLEPEDVWLEPLVAPGMDERTAGWDTSLPDWLTSLLQRFSPKTQPPEVDALDDPGNRIWLSLLAAARPRSRPRGVRPRGLRRPCVRRRPVRAPTQDRRAAGPERRAHTALAPLPPRAPPVRGARVRQPVGLTGHGRIGRRSKGVESTTVVRVWTSAFSRSRRIRSSRSAVVRVRTLRT